ncbi:MAG: energy transducer TonB [Saprospirales bacterium]|nr:MAG: energy transducer TonB [Saprospirales bacterium]
MQLLLKQATGRDLFSLSLLSPFITLTLKKRIKMIANKKSNPTRRLILAGLCLFLVGTVSTFGMKNDISAMSLSDAEIDFPSTPPIASDTVPTPPNVAPPPEPAAPPPPQPPPAPETSDLSEKEIFQVVEQMPRFPGCEDVSESIQERKACADQKMLEFVYMNIKYPEEARQDSIQGQVVVTFIVSDEGEIVNPRVVRDIGGGCGDEALRVIKLMNEMEERWIPGSQRGRNVHVQFNLPVRFTLQ